MDDATFDALLRALASRTIRRGVLAGLTGGLLTRGLASGEVSAASSGLCKKPCGVCEKCKKGRCKKKNGKKTCKPGKCQPKRFGAACGSGGQICQGTTCACPSGQKLSGGVCGVEPTCDGPGRPCSTSCCSSVCFGPPPAPNGACDVSRLGDSCREDVPCLGGTCIGFVCR